MKKPKNDKILHATIREVKRSDVPEDTVRYKMCAKKKRYRSYKEAATMANKARKVSGEENIDAYHCRFCHGWHIGHNKYAKIDKTARPHN